ncbi:MAG TPA: SUF system NifU family Fe-S cluster assembly protein [Candidatus Omnitrophota bacterium]|jgi:nitrogen fixation NifU-like protein|nr:MAG: NifU-like protein [Candidatus Omnitrophica bacterium ADurb.Bin314]HOE69259.1 SUF system NifU family Fe-S cluster assembly protein [Candidatus Omnitrophota bacterium]HPW64813.1 SUF system NifU family Fe-S cluster assembly protein [Candidatus Omnitrophota bacterium]HQB94530.1 SUF system NifU family Fe-S cluster assembly protein [Candidatus Omnitrophota bacterium]
MNPDLRDLYQQMIMDHNKNPMNFREIRDATSRAEGFNPLCGDHLHVYLKMNGDRIEDISFEGAGCAISKASGSMMTAALKGKTRAEAEGLFAEVRAMLSREPGMPVNAEKLGKLAVFAGVCEFPLRVKCASLAWHTMMEAIAPTGKQVSTE